LSEKNADISPDSDTTLSPEYKKPCSDIPLDDPKDWFRAELAVIRTDIQKECIELKFERVELREQVLEKIKTIVDLENNVVSLSNELDKVDMDSVDVDRAHPVGKTGNQRIVKFTNDGACSRLYANKKRLKNFNRKV
jgi:hypothetical protein